MIRERMQDLNDYESGRYASHGGGMSPFLMGAITGAAVALLFAPKPGSESRHWLAEKARQLRHRGENELEGMDREYGEGSRGSYETRSGAGSTGSYGTTGTGTTGTTAPKGPTTTNPVPTSPTGSARVE